MNIYFYIVSYLIGSISFAILLSKLFRLPDPRLTGSLNPGATNMLRSSGKLFAILTLLGDCLKGFLIVLAARYLNLSDMDVALIAFFCFLGHLYPVYHSFKGGKGVAVTLGILLGLNYSLAILALIVWIVLACLFRYSSLAALLAVNIILMVNVIFYNNNYNSWLLLLILIMLIFTHRSNIKRLLNKKEAKLF